MNISDRLLTIFIDLFNINNSIPYNHIRPDKISQWDSLNHLNLIISIENEFGINIEPEDFPKLYTDFEKIDDYLKAKING